MAEMSDRYRYVINGFEAPLDPQIPPENDENMTPYVKPKRKTDHLPKGWQKTADHRPILCDILFDQHLPLKLRDGVTIYMDILRPGNTTEKIPALLAVSPYGKGGLGFQILENCPFRLGIKKSFTSGLEKFESVDPGDWCNRGYAIVNIDIRGSWESEGILPWEGKQCGRDVYDMVEFVAQMDWCSGAVGMQGNSWLAASQWAGAIQKPPHLKAIAPWEAFTDMYRQTCCRGGIPNVPFFNFIRKKTTRGRQVAEDCSQSLRNWPLYNDYWDDKNCEVDEIDIPMYVVASYSSAIHGFGTIGAWKRAKSKQKWLRIHGTQEWWDLYLPESNAGLQKFFDKYLKGIENDWEETPPVQVSIVTMHKTGPIENQPEKEYPLARTSYRKLFLDRDTLTPALPEGKGTKSYVADDYSASPAEFVFKFDKETTLVGYSKAKLWVSSTEHDDMDVYVSLRKISVDGKLMEHINVPFSALPETVQSAEDVPNANVIKVNNMSLYPDILFSQLVSNLTDGVVPRPDRDFTSLAPLSRSRQVHGITPFHPHDRVEKIKPGTITPIEIGIWPMGIHFAAGEGVILRVQGHLDQYPEFPHHVEGKPMNLNKGRHTVHFGGEYDSFVVLPFV